MDPWRSKHSKLLATVDEAKARGVQEQEADGKLGCVNNIPVLGARWEERPAGGGPGVTLPSLLEASGNRRVGHYCSRQLHSPVLLTATFGRSSGQPTVSGHFKQGSPHSRPPVGWKHGECIQYPSFNVG